MGTFLAVIGALVLIAFFWRLFVALIIIVGGAAVWIIAILALITVVLGW